MDKRNYELKDIYDYLLKYYNIDWVGYKVLDDKSTRELRQCEVDKIQGDLQVVAVAYNGSKLENIKIKVSNKFFIVSSDKTPKVTWLEFLAERYNNERTFSK